MSFPTAWLSNYGDIIPVPLIVVSIPSKLVTKICCPVYVFKNLNTMLGTHFTMRKIMLYF